MWGIGGSRRKVLQKKNQQRTIKEHNKNSKKHKKSEIKEKKTPKKQN